MKLRARVGRQLAVGIALARAAIVLPSAALAASGTTYCPAATSAPACRGASTEAWVGLPGDGAAGTILYELE